jgi:serine/threonine-protein kinase HipA
MTLYIGGTERDRAAFRVRAHREQLRKLYRGVYTDDFERPSEDIVRESALAIVGAILPEWQMSHSSAAARGPVDGLLFLSGPGKAGRSLHLPGLRIVRFHGLEAPEHDVVPSPTEVIRGVDRPQEPVDVRVSTPLQTIFECLGTARGLPQKLLPDFQVADLIARLSDTDRARAERFAARNGLRREHLRYQALRFDVAASARVRVAEPNAADIFFYGWRIGTLTWLGGGEYRFAYDADWPLPLSKELPLVREGACYEGRRMPAFFENCLPEGWTESVVLASNKLAREDLFGLFSTTRKYLSNLTLRPLGIPEAELVYDAHAIRLDARRGQGSHTLRVREEIGAEPGDPALWRRARADGPLRLSGVQAKLPVSLSEEDGAWVIRIGGLRRACTHILKVPSGDHPGLVENEWATMELARRIGLPAASVARVEFQPGSPYRAPCLLVERYDIPNRETPDLAAAGADLTLQEDTCSLLLLRREEKYRTSMERIAEALLAAGVPAEADWGMRRFLQLALFSWIIGNGDLHAKNVSVLRRFRPGRPGEAPAQGRVEHAPFYDLVNTRLHLPGDSFALPLDGRQSNIPLKSFVRLADRWGMSADAVREEASRMVTGMAVEMPTVLAQSGLAPDLVERYLRIVHENAAALGLGDGRVA